MTVNAARARFAAFGILLIVGLPPTIARGQPPAGTPDNQNSPQAANPKRPEDTSRKTEISGQSAETVKWTDVYIWRLMACGIGVQVIGFALVWWQVRQVKRGIQGETHSKLYDHYLRVTERLAVEKSLRPYFYNGKELKEDAAGYADLREEVDMMCEMIAGLLEHATVQKKNLPVDTWRDCWEAYTNERFEKSVELRKFFRGNHKWYAESFRQVVKGNYPHLVLNCGCKPEQCAGEEEVKKRDCPVSPTPSLA